MRACGRLHTPEADPPCAMLAQGGPASTPLASRPFPLPPSLGIYALSPGLDALLFLLRHLVPTRRLRFRGVSSPGYNSPCPELPASRLFARAPF